MDKKKEKEPREKDGKKDNLGVYIPTEDEVAEKREWSEENKL